MKNITIAITFTLMIVMILTACNNEYIFATQQDCNTCISPKPGYGPVTVHLTIRKDQNPVILKIYEGKLSEPMLANDSLAIYIDTVNYTPVQIDVPVNENYTAVAQYDVNGRIVKAIDGSELNLYSVKATCNMDCWIYKGGSMDCTLKFK